MALLRTRRGADATSDEAFARAIASKRQRLAIGVLAVWIGLIALAALLAWRQYGDSTTQAKHDLRNRAIVAGTVFDTYFAGQIGTLQAIAAAPSVRSAAVDRMGAYFSRVQRTSAGTFTAGIGWLDLQGYARASSTAPGAPPQSYADRLYFQQVLATGRPYISQALVTRRKPLRRIVVTAVPTRDQRGRISGVLTGAILLRPSAGNPRATDLGYAGLEIVDRAGQQLTLQSLAHPANGALVRTLKSQKEGVLSGGRGLDRGDGHVVAFATSKAPDWTIVIDRPESAVFAPARRSLLIELGAIAAAGVLGLFVIAWASRWSRRQLRDERSRIGAWAALTRSLNGATDPDDVRSATAEALAAQFPAALALVALLPPASAGGDVSVSAGTGSPFPTSSARPLLGIVRDVVLNGGIALTDTESVRNRLRDLDDWVQPSPGSIYAERLVVGGRSAGGVLVALPLERALGDDDRAVIRAHADQAGEALARIAHHRIEHEAAVVLQRSLLPARLPRATGIEMAARYHAAGAGVEVGGDWYDAVCRQDAIVHLTVGDVAGHGIPAATLMGQLRTAFNAYAFDHTSPSEIVDRVARHVQEDHMVTMACVTFDLLTGRLTYATAGHVPPLVVYAGTRTSVRLDGPGRPPLGWESQSVVDDHQVEIEGPATLALYTDGLVERRDRPIDDGIDRLGALIVAHQDVAAAAADRIVSDLVGPGARDDAALLLVRLLPAPARIRLELPASAPLLAELRRRLRAWLSLRGIAGDESEEIVLAVSEACNNAIEHAYRGAAGIVVLDLQHDGSEMSITVEDRGTWREAHHDPARGRGLAIMHRLMPATTIERGPDGTRVVLRRTPA